MYPLIETIAGSIQEFSHTLVDRTRTEVRCTRSNLIIDLFTQEGESIVANIDDAPYCFYPGMKCIVDPGEYELHIASFYLHTRFRGRGIGSSFTEHLLRAAKQAGLQRATLFPDPSTNAQGYWTKKGFRFFSRHGELYMKREL